jgi:O-antigen/teichoic acid export membrane protein
MKSTAATSSTVVSRSLRHAAHGTIMVTVGQGCFFVLGYLTVVLLARELGPQLYASYGVILSVLLWLEGAGKRPFVSAAAKLLAESGDDQRDLEKTAFVLNLALFGVFFIILWIAAPWLASWFGIPNGTFLLRLAAIDLPLFGIFTALEAIHQGHRRFLRLSIAKIAYAAAKLFGVLFIVYIGISVEKALLANAFATLGGIVALLTKIHLGSKNSWLSQFSPIFALAIPMGVYSFFLPLLGWLNLWTVQVMSSPAEAATVGLFVGALNIARVPGFTLASMTVVLLPSISRAVAQGDMNLAQRYIAQSLRFFLIVYLPTCLVLMARPDELMQWIYSKDYSGGGALLSLLVVGSGLDTVHAMFASVLMAEGRVKLTAAITGLCLVPALSMVVPLVHFWGAFGGAVSAILTPLLLVLIFGVLVTQRFGALLEKRSVFKILAAGGLMVGVDMLLPRGAGAAVLLHLLSLAVFFGVLFYLGEITWKDLARFVPRHGRDTIGKNERE